jgi:parallel beta-helix repeat protein
MISKLNNKMYLFSSCKIQSSNFYTHIFFIVILLSTSLHAQDYYVSHELGSDGNNGLETSPFQTINRAISEVEAGGTVYVMEGTYRNQNYGTVDPSTNTNMSNPHVVTINKSGLENNYITLKNYPGHSPVIEFDGKGGIQIANDMNYIIVEGFEVIGPSQAINYDMAMDNRAYKVAVAEDGDSSTNYNHSYFSGKGIWGGYGAHHHIIIRNNIVHDTPGSGIRFNDSDHITIENNTVYNTTWWTSSASSAVVFAETIASSEADNGTNIKMIIRGNLVYNNWNRIPFYVTQLPDNSGNENPNYGTADYNSIVDGQGLYVTRSDPSYNGTFLFENNICVNNGKNGINFDNSLAASAIIRNNTLYFNGVHEYIQDLSVAEGNPSHRGQNVAGIKSNKVLNSTVVNNIVITRPLEDAPSYYENGFTALQLNRGFGE